jgi:hypothetical protein
MSLLLANMIERLQVATRAALRWIKQSRRYSRI